MWNILCLQQNSIFVWTDKADSFFVYFYFCQTYSYLHQYLYSLEKDVKLDALEAINEKIRKRCRNPKLSNSSCSGVFKHASVAWCRSLVIKLVTITPLNSSVSGDVTADVNREKHLCLELRTNDFWSPSFGNPTHLASLEAKWNTLLSKVEHVVIKKTSEENLETAYSLMRSAYSFYRDSSSMVLLSGVNLFWAPAQLITTGQLHPSADGAEIIDVSVPRKLLMWAYTLLHGRCPGISAVVKYCEENVKVCELSFAVFCSYVFETIAFITEPAVGWNKRDARQCPRI